MIYLLPFIVTITPQITTPAIEAEPVRYILKKKKKTVICKKPKIKLRQIQ
tara:strand:- start:1170 stop:1319 length:150 start_codon:yes stop_codon:yes gene_type:complete